MVSQLKEDKVGLETQVSHWIIVCNRVTLLIVSKNSFSYSIIRSISRFLHKEWMVKNVIYLILRLTVSFTLTYYCASHYSSLELSLLVVFIWRDLWMRKYELKLLSQLVNTTYSLVYFCTCVGYHNTLANLDETDKSSDNSRSSKSSYGIPGNSKT